MITASAADVKAAIADDVVRLRKAMPVTAERLASVDDGKRRALVAATVRFNAILDALPDKVAAQSPFPDFAALARAVYVETASALEMVTASLAVLETKGSA